MTTYRRRTVLGALAGAFVGVAGCVESGEGNDKPSQNATNGADEQLLDTGGNETDAADETDTSVGHKDEDVTDPCENDGEIEIDEQRQTELDRLSQRSPLAESLEQLYIAADRAAFAARRQRLSYTDGTVRVSITLEPDGEVPRSFVPANAERYGNTVITRVAVDDLVDLALDENVRAIDPEPVAVTHDEQDEP